MVAWSEAYLLSVAQQRRRWATFLDGKGEAMLLDEAARKRLKPMVQQGVPPELRHRVWRLTSGSVAKQRRAGVTYDQLLRRYQGVSGAYDDQIGKDLARTLPGHARYTDEAAGGRAALARVLRAYSLWQPTVGYCQVCLTACLTRRLSLPPTHA